MYLYLPTCLHIYPSIPCILGCSLLPVTVTTWIVTFLVRDPCKPSFSTVTGRGQHISIYMCIYNLYLQGDGFDTRFLWSFDRQKSPQIGSFVTMVLRCTFWFSNIDHGLAASLISMVTQANSRERTHWLTSFWRVYQIGSESSRCSTI